MNPKPDEQKQNSKEIAAPSFPPTKKTGKKEAVSLTKPLTDKEKQELYRKTVLSKSFAIVAYVMRHATSKENPMTARAIGEAVTDFIAQNNTVLDKKIEPRTISRELEQYLAFKETFGESDPNIMAIEHCLGGRIILANASEVAQSIRKGKSKKQKKYFFEPYLDKSDCQSLLAIINSNQFLNKQEKEYLSKRVNILLAVTHDYDDIKNVMAPKPGAIGSKPRNIFTPRAKGNPLSQNESFLLSHISQLQGAIEKKYCVTINYGHYAIDDYGKVVFVSDSEKDATIHPFGLLWYRGHYYLIAVKEGEDFPRHYRIDRFRYIMPLKDPSGKFHPRCLIPTFLQDFFTGDTFNAKEYLHKYPHMAYYKEKHSQRCTLRCNERALSIIIDYFGPSNLFTKKVIDQESLLEVSFGPIQYENLMMFCLHHCDAITPVGPDNFVKAYKEELMKILKRLPS